jgi:hypothetical protein
MLDAENKKVSAERLGLNCGTLYKGRTDKNRPFCAKLIEVVGDVLVFETRNKLTYFHKMSELQCIEPYTAPEKSEVV